MCASLWFCHIANVMCVYFSFSLSVSNKTCTQYLDSMLKLIFLLHPSSRHVTVNNYSRCRPINTSFAPSFLDLFAHPFLCAPNRIEIKLVVIVVAIAASFFPSNIITFFFISDFSHKHTSITCRWCRMDSQKSTYESSLQAASSSTYFIVLKTLFGFRIYKKRINLVVTTESRPFGYESYHIWWSQNSIAIEIIFFHSVDYFFYLNSYFFLSFFTCVELSERNERIIF